MSVDGTPIVGASREVAAQHAFRGGIVNLLGLLARLARPAFWITATRMYGASRVGEFAVAVALLELARLVTTSGTADGVVRFVARDTGREGAAPRVHEVLATAIWFCVATGAAVIALVGFGGHQWLAQVTRRPLVDEWTGVLVWSLPLLGISDTLVAATRAHMVMRWNALLLGLLQPMLQLLLLVAFFLAGATDAGLAWAWLLGALGTAVAAVAVSGRYFDLKALWRALRRPRWQGELLRFVWPANANMALNYVSTSIDLVMLGMFGVPSAHLALYNAGIQLTRNLQGIKTAFGASFSPLVARFEADRRGDELTALFRQLSRLTLIAVLPPALVVAGLYPDLLRLFDPGFTAGTGFVPLLLVVPILACSLGLATTLIVMSGHVGVNLGNGLLGGAINVGLNALLIPRAGLAGAAVATVTTAVVIRLVTVAQVRRLLGVRPDPGELRGPLGLGAILAALLWVAVPQAGTLIGRIGLTAASVVLFGIGAWRWLLRAEDRAMLVQEVRRLSGRGRRR